MNTKIIIKSAKIIAPESKFHLQEKDILIEDGIIKNIDSSISVDDSAKIIQVENLHLSMGWLDMRANFCDPGLEHKETFATGCKAAAAGGFTAVCVLPTTNPIVQSKAQIEYILSKAKGNLVEVLPIGALTENLEGKDIPEMIDMSEAGAVAFANGNISLQDSGTMLRALLYSKMFDGLVYSFPNDKYLSKLGVVNEGINSTKLGLKGMPALAEELMIIRDIALAEYAETKVHFSRISSAKSVEIIREAKAKGLPVTASVAAHHLILNDSFLENFDTNYKILPPLRTEQDQAKLIEALVDGTIDVVCSDHSPQDTESKFKEFDLAEYGVIGLETAFSVVSTVSSLNPTELVKCFAIQPRKILKQNLPEIKVGEKANFTLFNPTKKWTFKAENIQSKSKNTPFINEEFTGKVLGVVRGDELFLNG